MNLTNFLHSVTSSPLAPAALVVIVKLLANSLSAPTDKSSGLYRTLYALAHLTALNLEKFSFQAPMVLKSAASPNPPILPAPAIITGTITLPPK